MPQEILGIRARCQVPHTAHYTQEQCTHNFQLEGYGANGPQAPVATSRGRSRRRPPPPRAQPAVAEPSVPAAATSLAAAEPSSSADSNGRPKKTGNGVCEQGKRGRSNIRDLLNPTSPVERNGTSGQANGNGDTAIRSSAKTSSHNRKRKNKQRDPHSTSPSTSKVVLTESQPRYANGSNGKGKEHEQRVTLPDSPSSHLDLYSYPSPRRKHDEKPILHESVPPDADLNKANSVASSRSAQEDDSKGPIDPKSVPEEVSDATVTAPETSSQEDGSTSEHTGDQDDGDVGQGQSGERSNPGYWEPRFPGDRWG